MGGLWPQQPSRGRKRNREAAQHAREASRGSALHLVRPLAAIPPGLPQLLSQRVRGSQGSIVMPVSEPRRHASSSDPSGDCKKAECQAVITSSGKQLFNATLQVGARLRCRVTSSQRHAHTPALLSQACAGKGFTLRIDLEFKKYTDPPFRNLVLPPDCGRIVRACATQRHSSPGHTSTAPPSQDVTPLELKNKETSSHAVLLSLSPTARQRMEQLWRTQGVTWTGTLLYSTAQAPANTEHAVLLVYMSHFDTHVDAVLEQAGLPSRQPVTETLLKAALDGAHDAFPGLSHAWSYLAAQSRTPQPAPVRTDTVYVSSRFTRPVQVPSASPNRTASSAGSTSDAASTAPSRYQSQKSALCAIAAEHRLRETRRVGVPSRSEKPSAARSAAVPATAASLAALSTPATGQWDSSPSPPRTRRRSKRSRTAELSHEALYTYPARASAVLQYMQQRGLLPQDCAQNSQDSSAAVSMSQSTESTEAESLSDSDSAGSAIVLSDSGDETPAATAAGAGPHFGQEASPTGPLPSVVSPAELAKFGSRYRPPPREAGVPLSELDLASLQGKAYLNDAVIDAVLKLRLRRGVNHDTRSGVHIMSSLFYKQLCSIEQPKSGGDVLHRMLPAAMAVRGWTKRVDLFSKRLIIVPVNHAMHWSLAVIVQPASWAAHMRAWAASDPEGTVAERLLSVNKHSKAVAEPCIFLLDSLGIHRPKDICRALRAWLVWEFVWVEGQEELPANLPPQCLLPYMSLQVRQQDNSYDCGIYLLCNAELVLSAAANDSLRVPFEREQGLHVWHTAQKRLLARVLLSFKESTLNPKLARDVRKRLHRLLVAMKSPTLCLHYSIPWQDGMSRAKAVDDLHPALSLQGAPTARQLETCMQGLNPSRTPLGAVLLQAADAEQERAAAPAAGGSSEPETQQGVDAATILGGLSRRRKTRGRAWLG